MTGWLHNLEDESRRTSINQASLISGITPKALEKDWWVTLALKLLFDSKYGSFFTFKGGTSLSKGWQIIDRFSEDIDIALNSEAFGKKYVTEPSKTYVEQLRRAGCKFTSTEIANELTAQFVKFQIPERLHSIEIEEIDPEIPDKDPQIIYVNYKSLFDPNPYLPDRIKIEFSVRSQNGPSQSKQMQTLLNSYFPSELYNEIAFSVTSMLPEKTFIEKILLLHEEFNRVEESKIRTHRMSRHFYDIFRLFQLSEFTAALTDLHFINDIIAHRKSYSRLRHFDYSSLRIGHIQIIPPEKIITALKTDYDEMATEMIYGRPPTFPDLIDTAGKIQDLINQKM